ncbi:alpha/beta hydrolase [Kitasatospora sp. LaBMicrA B282]|uniref:alpha/beta hydrolase n=1 Tax=Kitasatospora sp. LaBMicrA B282 TaxID=3420949 RepID=UPI003D0E62FD
MTREHPAPAAEELGVAVPGGELAVLRWPAADPAAPTVLALHGVTGNGLAFGLLARELAGRATLVAPDLRGRAGSAGLGGPYGIARHAADAAVAIDRLLGGRPTVVLGHSMGAWVSTVLAVHHPALVRRLVLVDGALAFPLPAGVTHGEVLDAVLGPAVARLSMTFANWPAYRDFWQRHPAWSSLDTAAADAYLARDLTGAAAGYRSSCVVPAVELDSTQLLVDPEVTGAVHRLPCPAELLWADRGPLDDGQALYDAQRLARSAPAGLTCTRVPDTNHYSILLGPAGVPLVARRTLAALGAAD